MKGKNMSTSPEINIIDIGQQKLTGLQVDWTNPKKLIIRGSEIPIDIKNDVTFTFSKINSTTFTHGLHYYPAKFVPQLPRWAIKRNKINEGDVVLDPFSGSGTTLVEARLVGANSYGTDRDPLARLISKVKSTPIYTRQPNLLMEEFYRLSSILKSDKAQISLDDQADVNLHFNWNFWFEKDVMKNLIKIRRTINEFEVKYADNEKEAQDVRDFFLVCLSSIIKRVSYLDESQIKVKFSAEKKVKGVGNPISVFIKYTQDHITAMIHFSRECSNWPNAVSKIIGDDARDLPLEKNSVDLIVTSPPYINAIDYPFSHKHELFILNLMKPEHYRPESRKFIGVSERVLQKATYENLHLMEYRPVDEIIKQIFERGTDVDKNRAYIIYQYFDQMNKAFYNFKKVLKDGHKMVLFVGDNFIRKKYIPTHRLLNKMAEEFHGFKIDTSFYHLMKLKKLAIPRNETGAEIERELVTELVKA